MGALSGLVFELSGPGQVNALNGRGSARSRVALIGLPQTIARRSKQAQARRELPRIETFFMTSVWPTPESGGLLAGHLHLICGHERSLVYFDRILER
jgi:hypothetical protein